MTSFSNNGIGGGIGCDMLYDPIMEPLVQSSLAHFLYMKKNPIDFKEYENGDQLPDRMPFHPNYLRFQFLDTLIEKKASVTLGTFKLYDFSPSTTHMDRDKLMLKVNKLLQHSIIKELVYSFIHKIQVEVDAFDSILGFVPTKTKPTRGLGLLYFILIDLYLEYVDLYIYETINKYQLNCFWGRCLNTAILGFSDKKTVPKYKKILKLDSFFPACGLTAKERAGSRGGRVLRPFRGKLYINIDGHLQWERPESIIDM
ncbi:hypothetical protein MLD38_040504 [Melastoma candidum]|nr:hypothetical protein MLD38_040504 [Melastoma candidum]